jgi:6-phosphogluconate dehydrogenase
MAAGTTVGVIETGVPIPPKGGTGKWSAIDLLEVGQSTVVRDTDIYRAHCAFGRRYRRNAAKRFSARTIAPGTVRVWRVS